MRGSTRCPTRAVFQAVLCWRVIGLFRIDSGAARATQVGPKPVSPAGFHRAAPPAVIPAAAFMASGIKPVICACGDGAEPNAGSSEAARCYAAGVPSSMSETASVTAAACSATSKAVAPRSLANPSGPVILPPCWATQRDEREHTFSQAQTRGEWTPLVQ